MNFIAMCKLMYYVACNGPQSTPVTPKLCNAYVADCPVCGCCVRQTVENCPDCMVAFDWSKARAKPGEVGGRISPHF